MGQTKARCVDNGCSIGKRRNAGMARVQGFPSGVLPGGHPLRYALLQWNNHCKRARLAYNHLATRCGATYG